jgi:hypothetical protein
MTEPGVRISLTPFDARDDDRGRKLPLEPAVVVGVAGGLEPVFGVTGGDPIVRDPECSDVLEMGKKKCNVESHIVKVREVLGPEVVVGPATDARVRPRVSAEERPQLRCGKASSEIEKPEIANCCRGPVAAQCGNMACYSSIFQSFSLLLANT